jgi:uncharacterized membrane-anchored protein
MIRILIISLSLFAIYKGGLWLLDHPGHVMIDWLGFEITLHMAALSLLLLVFALIVGYFSVLVWRLSTWPTRRRARNQHRTFKRGLEHLTRGVTALAMGDEKLAEESLKKARLALPHEPLPQLLTAQMLQRQGKHGDAHAQFRMLMAHPSTSGLATRKLIEQHVQRHEWAEALRLTEEAQKTTPRDGWLALTRIDLSAREKDAAQMLALTEGWQWQSPLTKEQRHRYAALAHYLAAEHTEATTAKKERSLRHAIGYAPDFLPAIIAYAEHLMAQDEFKQARKTLLAAWRANPCTLLTRPILESIAEESAETQQRLLKPFLRGDQTAAHHVLEARQALETEEYPRARAALEKAIALDGTRESILLMAEIEHAARDTHAASAWTARAVHATTGNTWVCQDCGQQHEQWHTHCSACGHFDTLRYERPEARVTSVDIAPA